MSEKTLATFDEIKSDPGKRDDAELVGELIELSGKPDSPVLRRFIEKCLDAYDYETLCDVLDIKAETLSDCL